MQLNHYLHQVYPNATYTQNNVGGSNPGTANVTKTGCTKKLVYSAGTRLKNFKSRLAAGELLPFTSFNKYTLETLPGYMAYSWAAKTGNASYHISGNTQALGYDQVRPYSVDHLRTIASRKLPAPNTKTLVQSAAADVYSQGYDLLTAIGEGSKTIQMIGGLKGRLKEILKAEAKDMRNVYRLLVTTQKQLVLARKNHQLLALAHNRGARLSTDAAAYALRTSERRIRAMQRTIKDAGRRIDRYASGYLEARYGWRTLWFDMCSFAKEINSPTNTQKDSVFTNHRQKTSDTIFSTEKQMSAIGGTWTQYIEYTITRSTRATVSAKFSASRFRGNVAVTAWELVTLSFVVDWFISVGAAIKAASLLALSSKVQAAVSSMVTVDVRIVESDPVNAASAKNLNVRLASSVTFEELTRTPSGVSIVPQFQKKLDTFKILDLVAISTQMLRGRIRDMKRYNG